MGLHDFGIARFDPETGGERPLFMDEETERQLRFTSSFIVSALKQFRTELFGSPATVFRGLNRATKDDDLCYSITLPPSAIMEGQDLVLVGFVHIPPIGESIITWAELRKPDPKDPRKPLNWRNDFREVCHER